MAVLCISATKRTVQYVPVIEYWFLRSAGPTDVAQNNVPYRCSVESHFILFKAARISEVFLSDSSPPIPSSMRIFDEILWQLEAGSDETGGSRN